MADSYDETSSNFGGKRDTNPVETGMGTATVHLMSQLHRIMELVDPARGELTKLKHSDNKMQHDSNETFELQKQLHVAGERNAKLTEGVEKFRKLYQTTSKNLKAANTTIQKCEMSMTAQLAQLDDHKKEIDAYKEVHSNFENQLISKSEEIEELKSFKADLSMQFKALKRDKEEKITRLGESLNQLKVEKNNVEKELSETKSRLSKLMGDKLSNNNPDIADLSDEYRPTKLAEKYQELYDNQWTDAFEKAEKWFVNQSEKTGITVLQLILQNVYQFCNKEVAEQERDFMKAMFRTSDTKELHSAIPENIRTKLKELKRFAVSKSTEYLLEKYLMDCDKSNEMGRFTEHSRDYVHECINLCWHMVNQNPPVVLHLGVNSGDKFDGSMYKHYTITGTVVDFVVWPALLLCENGSLLSKGVVQCVKLLQGSQSVRTRSKKVNATEMGIQSGSLRLTNTVAQGDVADLQHTKAQSELNKNHGQNMKRDQTAKTEKVHNEINVKLTLPTDNTEKPMKNEQLHNQHSTMKSSQGDVHHLIPTDSQCKDNQQNSRDSKQATDEVVNEMQKFSENIHKNETASDYVHEFQRHEDRSPQTQFNAASFQQYQPHAANVRQIQPNNFHNNFSNNENVSQLHCGSFQQYQSNTHISKQQQQQQHHYHHQQQQQQQQQQHNFQQQQQMVPQSHKGAGQAPSVQTSAQATYGNQHQQPWAIHYPTQEQFDFYMKCLFYGNAEHARLAMGDQVYYRCMNYYNREVLGIPKGSPKWQN